MIRIEGDVDPEDASNLERAAWDAFGSEGVRLILDLEQCTHLSSTGLGVLFSLVRWVRPKGGMILAVRPQAAIVQLLRQVHLADERGFQVFADLESVREVVGPPGA